MKGAAAIPETILICIGNEFREDDALGLYIGRNIKARCLQGLRIIENSGDGMAMMDAWKGGGTVILIDAVRSWHPPGTIFHFDLLKNPVPSDLFILSSHNVGIPECIALSEKLDLLPQKLFFYGIEGKNFGQGTELSPTVKAAADALIEKIAADLKN